MEAFQVCFYENIYPRLNSNIHFFHNEEAKTQNIKIWLELKWSPGAEVLIHC